MRPGLFVALALALGSCSTLPLGNHAGALVVVGGGGTPDDVVLDLFMLAGGRDANMVILAQASGRPEAGEESVAWWKGKGFERVASLDLSDAAAARRAIESATLIWFPGGDQSRLLDAIEKANLADAIHARHRAGAVVGGTSAGAAVLSAWMIVGGETADLTVVRSGSVAVVKGLDLLPGTIIDQHFLKRQRFNRLLSAVLEQPDLVGIGIDEKTAILVRGTHLDVLGESGVLVVDARGTKRDEPQEKGRPAGGTARLTLLRAGMDYELPAHGGD
jgi:cyanophycinase